MVKWGDKIAIVGSSAISIYNWDGKKEEEETLLRERDKQGKRPLMQSLEVC